MNALFQLTHFQPWFLTLTLGSLGAGGYIIFYAASRSLINGKLVWLLLCVGSALIGNNVMALFGIALTTSLSHLESRSQQLYQAVMQGHRLIFAMLLTRARFFCSWQHSLAPHCAGHL